MFIKISYGVGYGSHKDELELEDDLTDEEIEKQVEQYVTERLDWGWRRAE